MKTLSRYTNKKILEHYFRPWLQRQDLIDRFPRDQKGNFLCFYSPCSHPNRKTPFASFWVHLIYHHYFDHKFMPESYFHDYVFMSFLKVELTFLCKILQAKLKLKNPCPCPIGPCGPCDRKCTKCVGWQTQMSNEKSLKVIKHSKSMSPFCSCLEEYFNNNPDKHADILSTENLHSLAFFQSPKDSRLDYPGFNLKGSQLRGQILTYGPNLFSFDEEGKYVCFFKGCNRRMLTNFSRHITIHQRNGDSIDLESYQCNCSKGFISLKMTNVPKRILFGDDYQDDEDFVEFCSKNPDKLDFELDDEIWKDVFEINDESSPGYSEKSQKSQKLEHPVPDIKKDQIDSFKESPPEVKKESTSPSKMSEKKTPKLYKFACGALSTIVFSETPKTGFHMFNTDIEDGAGANPNDFTHSRNSSKSSLFSHDSPACFGANPNITASRTLKIPPNRQNLLDHITKTATIPVPGKPSISFSNTPFKQNQDFVSPPFNFPPPVYPYPYMTMPFYFQQAQEQAQLSQIQQSQPQHSLSQQLQNQQEQPQQSLSQHSLLAQQLQNQQKQPQQSLSQQSLSQHSLSQQLQNQQEQPQQSLSQHSLLAQQLQNQQEQPQQSLSQHSLLAQQLQNQQKQPQQSLSQHSLLAHQLQNQQEQPQQSLSQQSLSQQLQNQQEQPQQSLSQHSLLAQQLQNQQKQPQQSLSQQSLSQHSLSQQLQNQQEQPQQSLSQHSLLAQQLQNQQEQPQQSLSQHSLLAQQLQNQQEQPQQLQNQQEQFQQSPFLHLQPYPYPYPFPYSYPYPPISQNTQQVPPGPYPQNLFNQPVFSPPPMQMFSQGYDNGSYSFPDPYQIYKKQQTQLYQDNFLHQYPNKKSKKNPSFPKIPSPQKNNNENGNEESVLEDEKRSAASMLALFSNNNSDS